MSPALATLSPCAPSVAADPLWQRQLGLLLESTGEGIFGIDLAGHCMFINPAGARMLGWEADAVLGRNMHWLTHHSHADGSAYPDSECPIFNAFRQGLPCRIDTEVFWRRDGSAFAVEYSSHPILDGEQVRGAVITFLDITERKRAEQALQRAKDELEQRVNERTRELSAALGQLRELSAYLESVREEERTRIAREVHDELGSLLVALRMDVNWLDKRLGEQQAREPGEAQAMRDRMRCKCGNMSRLIESAVDNVGRIITDLRPSILDHQGLWAALEWQAQEFAQAGELALDWDVPDAPLPELPEPAAMAVFRIFQEMLSNIGRHAQARRVRVRIECTPGLLALRVQDDGRGALPEAFDAPDAYGVMGMRERALHLGGTLTIESRLGQGCAFDLRLPIAAQAAERP
ncbi:PAS domain-containing sensor histidine kinase [Variovorax dokdonensis]|uniref:PAS domain-containing sensor histidine kinase n=1 Tax=Variovorax dokdonensis TaxID=344883 RepID=A0ABT7NBP6_9BURK|nr:PAS domain-containing sensor histidine kinase [Variovorax dokdonensis]MDM0045357.1 PAS domain-containing sensor histidine kinase [Variovorax dokdonensis]